MSRIKLLHFHILFCFYNLACSKELKTSLLPGTDVCGKQEEQRIFGGEEAVLGEFPWLVLLGLNIDNQTNFFCGGALINNRYVLTAAHCLDNPDLTPSLFVRLGEHNTETDIDCEGSNPGLEYCLDAPVDVKVEKVTNHKDFDLENDKLLGDISLIRLAKEVKYTDSIKPICLPVSSELKNVDLVGSTVVAAGWGVTENNTSINDVKLKVELPVISNAVCSKPYEEEDITLVDTQLCAGGEEGKDTCQGDSGGPLMYRHRTESEENWINVGIVSFGLGCGKVPGIYTKVADYLEWISDNIEP